MFKRVGSISQANPFHEVDFLGLGTNLSSALGGPYGFIAQAHPPWEKCKTYMYMGLLTGSGKHNTAHWTWAHAEGSRAMSTRAF